MSTDIDTLIAEVLRLDGEATPGPWHRRDAETENGYMTSAVSPDTAEEDGLSPCDLPIAGRTITTGISGNNAALVATFRTAAPLLAAEVKRLRNGGCARDQRTTQFCAEAVAKDAEIAELRLALAAEQGRQEGAPDPAWIRKMMNGESYWEKWYPAGDVAIVRLDGSFSRGRFDGKTAARHGKADNQRAAMLAADEAQGKP